MKRKLTIALLGLTMVLTLAACGGKEYESGKQDKEEISISTEADEKEPKNDFNKRDELSTSEKDEIKEESTESNESPDLENSGGEVSDGREYSIEDLESMIPNDGIVMTTENSGFTITVGKQGKDSLVKMTYEGTTTDFYIIKDQMYAYVNDVNGETYLHTKIGDGENFTESLTEGTVNVDFSNAEKVTYVNTVDYNGGTYDVVRVDGTEEGTPVFVNYYVNVDTQKIDYISDDVSTISIEYVDAIILPNDFIKNTITEVTEEQMAGVLLNMMSYVSESTGQ